MPPRASLTSTFTVADANNEVVCPLRNQDGSSCRKRCLGEKRYRSMQEHIRRAHPEYYIAKLPATKESFDLMINSPPHERPPPPTPSQQQQQQQQTSSPQRHRHQQQHSDPSGLSPAFHLDTSLNSYPQGYGHNLSSHDGGYYTAHDAEAAAIFNSMQAQARTSDEYRRGSLIPAASAAQALAQLHYHRGPDSDWGDNNISQNFYADQHNDLKNHHHLHSNHHYHVDPSLEDSPFMQDPNAFPASSAVQDQTGLLPSSLTRSPSSRSAALPPLHRSLSAKQHQRPRKSSLSQQARLAKHERRKSKDLAKRNSGDKKAFGEAGAVGLLGKRWEDLIDAAASATEEEDSRDLTPIPASPYQSPQAGSRTSLPPFALGSQFQSFQASPLTRALTPPQADANLEMPAFESVDSSLSSHQHNDSAGSGSNFHIMNAASMESSPMFSNATANSQHVGLSQSPVQIYCAGCKKLNNLSDSYACTNCICGLCGTCVEALVDNQRNGRLSGCPRCQLNYGQFKQFQLDLR